MASGRRLTLGCLEAQYTPAVRLCPSDFGNTYLPEISKSPLLLAAGPRFQSSGARGPFDAMTQAKATDGMRQLRCAHCDDVIGVYEPLIHVIRGVVRRTSRAAEPGIRTKAGAFYHRDCYESQQRLETQRLTTRTQARLERPRSARLSHRGTARPRVACRYLPPVRSDQ